MKYKYKCTECKYTDYVEMSMKEQHPKFLWCPKCARITYKRKLEFSKNIIIPFQFTDHRPFKYDKMGKEKKEDK